MFGIWSSRDRALTPAEQVIEGQLVGRPAMPRTVEQAVTYGVAKQYGSAIVNGARIRGIHYVAQQGLRAVADLEDEEAAAVARNQFTGGQRARRIVDTAADGIDEAVYVTGRAF